MTGDTVYREALVEVREHYIQGHTRRSEWCTVSSGDLVEVRGHCIQGRTKDSKKYRIGN